MTYLGFRHKGFWSTVCVLSQTHFLLKKKKRSFERDRNPQSLIAKVNALLILNFLTTVVSLSFSFFFGWQHSLLNYPNHKLESVLETSDICFLVGVKPWKFCFWNGFQILASYFHIWFRSSWFPLCIIDT